MLTQEVCRLCLSEDNLMCVFDKRLEKTDHMKEVILITTGVEIHSKDVISQKICTKCGRDAVKMFQFRQQSLKNDRYLKAQCRELLKHTDLKIPNTSVTIKTERMDKEEVKQEPPPKPLYRVHPTMSALSRKYPQMQFPSVCLMFDVDPYISMEMDTVENYFKNRKLNMRRYVQIALRASNEVIPKKTSKITKSLVKITENSQSTSTAIAKTVADAEVVDKISLINIKLNQSGYAIVKPSTESITHGEDKTICELTSSCRKLITSCPEAQTGIRESKKRRLSDNVLSKPETKTVKFTNLSNATPVHPNVEKISPPVFKCNICSSVEFSARDLKKHQMGHSCCNFCKTQFKSVGMKQQHINDSCLIKEAMNNMPDVQVEKVEMNMNVRIHHQEAFINFPPLPGLEIISSTSKSSKTEECIEIISDDEETTVSTDNSLSTKPICSNISAHTTSTVTKTLHENPPLSNPPVSLVIRPDVTMKNDNILNSLKRQTPDIEIVKELLTKFRKLQSATDEATQTELPTTESIRIKEGHFNAELINLKHILHSYQIPVEIREGPINAFYNYQPTVPRPKRLKLWDDLTPIDLETVKTEVSELVVIMDIPETYSNSNTNDGNSISTSEPCNSFNIDETPVQNIEIVLPASLNGSACKIKSPSISTQTDSLISTLDCTVVQAESPTSTYTRSPMLDASHSHSNTLEIFPVHASSSVGDMPIRRLSPNSSGTDSTTHNTNNHLIQVYPVQATSSILNIPSEQNSFGVDQTSQNNAYIINSELRRISPVQNISDLNARWKSLNTQSEAMDCSTKTRQDLTNKVIDHVFNKCGQSIDTATINARPPDNSNKKQLRLRISKVSKPPKRKNIQRDQNMRHTPATTNSRTNGPSSQGNAPIQKNTSNDNHLFIKPPPPYPPGSTAVSRLTQSYIPSYANTSNVPHGAENPQSNRYYNAFHQYISHLEEMRSIQTMDRTAGNFCPNTNNVAHHGNTGNFTTGSILRNSLENRSMLQVSEPFSYNGIESSSFPQYSMASHYGNTSVAVDTLNQNCNISNRQLPNATCTNSSTLAACDTFTYSVPPSDKSKHFVSGMIRVKNVSELT